MTEYFCVFDVGTTGARTIIFDINGNEIEKSYQEYTLVKQPVGISEQDPIIWWNAVKSTCNLVLKKVNPADIIGLSAAFHRATATLIDKDANVLHPALTWMDEREVVDTKEIQEEGGLRRTIPKILWLKKNKPELFNKAFKIIFPDTFLYMQLMGKDYILTEPTNGIYGILNMETLGWDEKLAEKYDLPIEMWPELHYPGKVIGELTSEAAEILGLRRNLPIILGGGDQQCSALGLGVIEKGQAKATTGTGTFIDYVTGDNPVKPSGEIPIFPLPHVIKGKWLLEGSIPGTGTALKWFKENFSQLQSKECKEKNLNIYEALTKEAEQIKPGSEGLLFIPLYIFRKGTIHGLGWNHTRGHMIRAIMESAALSGQVYIQLCEGMAGDKAEELRVDGGAMQSDLWAQMFADLTGKKVKVSKVKDGAGLGAAILGFYGSAKYSTIENAIEKMVRFSDIKEPNKENSKIYKKLMRIFMPILLDTFQKKRVTKDL